MNSLTPYVKTSYADGNRPPEGSFRFAIKTCTRTRHHTGWGDTNVANSLAKAIRKLGHKCEVHFRDEWNQPDTNVDIVIHIKGKFQYTPKPHNFNILWIISHPELHTIGEINRFDAVFCASKLYFENPRSIVEVPFFYLPQATDEDLFKPLNYESPKDIDILFVGNNYYKGKRRKIIQDVLDTGKKYNLYVVGKSWHRLLNQEYYKAEYVDWDKLPELYSRAKIVLNDHHETMKQFGFINNRTFDLAALKAFQISDYVKGMEEFGIVTYQTPADLREKLDYFLQNEKERGRIANLNYERCKNFTFINIARKLVAVVKKLFDEKSLRKTKDNMMLPSVSKPGETAPAVSLSRLRPKVSVITSCYNSEKFLPECLDSIRNQTLQEWELFLIDDCSTDGTKSVIEKYARMDKRIKPYYFQYNKGPYVRRNFAIERACSDFIVIHDADDIMCTNKLEVLYNEIAKDERLGIVGSFYWKFLEEFKGTKYAEKVEFSITHGEIIAKAHENVNFCCHGSAIIRRSLFNEIGLYDENPFGSDSFWLAKVVEYVSHGGNVRLMNIPEFLMLRRMHLASQTGFFPYFDPRSRRAKLREYRKIKINQFRERLYRNPDADLKEELKNCKCSDYIEKYGHLFERWESEPLGDNSFYRPMGTAVESFNSLRYVTCIIHLDGIEKIKCDITKRFKNYDLLRAMAYLAIGRRDQSLRYINNEIQNHDNSAAKKFRSDYFENQSSVDVQNWCFQNSRQYELHMIDLEDSQEANTPVQKSCSLSEERSYVGQNSRADAPSNLSHSPSGPKVSVITSCYNCEKFLPECLESIRSQTMQEWELFLLDDGSSDSTRSIIEKYAQMDERIKPYYFQDNKGPYVRRNFAIERACSDFIAIHDADDIMCPNKLEVLYREIISDDCLAVVGAFYRSFLDEFRGLQYTDEHKFSLEHNEIIARLLNWRFSVCHGSAIIRRSLFDEIGLYDENPFASDSFWLAKAAEYAYRSGRIKLKNIPELLMLKRMHSASQTGLLPTFDPRSRRAKFAAYCMDKFLKVREKLRNNPAADIAAELRNCKCSDFIEKHGHLFAQWESEPLNDDMLKQLIVIVVGLFNKHLCVSCIVRLEGMETMICDIAKRFKNYDLLRAMAYFALDRKQESLKYLNREIENHNSPAARKFISDYFENQLKTSVRDWCRQNSKFYNLQMVDIERKSGAQQENSAVSEQYIPAQQDEPEESQKSTSCGQTGPLVSVIMPAYNAVDYIKEAIESVLNQTYKDYELVVINDGSTDRTEDIVLGFKDEKIKYFRQENIGAWGARNRAIKESKGNFIINLDTDDMMTPDFIAKHLHEFEKHPEADLIYCDDYLIEQDGKPIRVIKRREYTNRKFLIRDLFRCGFPIVPFRTCIRKTVFDKIGFFDEDLVIGGDYDMMRRFVKNDLKIHHLDGALYLRRMTSNSLSRTFNAQKAKCLFEVVKRYTETFTYEELFPDVAWDEIAPQIRQLHAKCLAAGTYLAIGQDYVKTKAVEYSRTAFDKACSELNDCVTMNPENQELRQLLQKSELIRARYTEVPQQVVSK